MKDKIRIASGQGFWGDLLTAPVDQVTKGPIDYMMMDYLAEVTMSILELFGWRGDRKTQAPAASPADTETVRKIAAALDRLDPDKARYIAAFAYILSRVARADLQISDAELRTMEQLVQEKGGLPEEQAVMVVQMAKTQSILFGGVENFQWRV